MPACYGAVLYTWKTRCFWHWHWPWPVTSASKINIRITTSHWGRPITVYIIALCCPVPEICLLEYLFQVAVLNATKYSLPYTFYKLWNRVSRKLEIIWNFLFHFCRSHLCLWHMLKLEKVNYKFFSYAHWSSKKQSFYTKTWRKPIFEPVPYNNGLHSNIKSYIFVISRKQLFNRATLRLVRLVRLVPGRCQTCEKLTFFDLLVFYASVSQKLSKLPGRSLYHWKALTQGF